MLVLGGGMANTFLLAQGKAVGKSLAEHDLVEDARRDPGDGRGEGRPGDPAGRRRSSPRRSPAGTEYKTLPAEKIPASWHIVDVGKADAGR